MYSLLQEHDISKYVYEEVKISLKTDGLHVPLVSLLYKFDKMLSILTGMAKP